MIDKFINRYCELKHKLNGRQLTRHREGDATQAELIAEYRRIRSGLKHFFREVMTDEDEPEDVKEYYSDLARSMILKNLNH